MPGRRNPFTFSGGRDSGGQWAQDHDETRSAGRASARQCQDRACGRFGDCAGDIAVSTSWERAYDLRAGATIEISVHLEKPSTLPPNGRLGVEWTLAGDTGPAKLSGENPYGLYTRPTANWRKTLHALDSDVYLVYRAPRSGRYSLRLKPVVEETPVGDAGPRWRERGAAHHIAALPERTPWPARAAASVAVAVHPIEPGDAHEQESLHTIIECEPNDAPEQAQPITLTGGDTIRTWEITGGADDVEFFDNGLAGRSGDDWYRLEYRGKEARLLTAKTGIPGLGSRADPLLPV